MTEQPNLSKYCTKCNKFTDHWGSDCPQGDMLRDWIELRPDGHEFFVAVQHSEYPRRSE